MGCDFELLIQVRYGSNWLTVAPLGLKTRCGGYPLCNAARELFNKKKIIGNYGTNFKTISNKVDAAVLIKTGVIVEDINLKETYLEGLMREYKEREALKGKTVEDDPEQDENEHFLFYSKDDFAVFVTCLADLINTEPRHAFSFLLTQTIPIYVELLTPVPQWIEMARSAMPLGRETIWLSTDCDGVYGEDITAELVDKQKQLVDLYLDVLTETLHALPSEIIKLIAELAGPPKLDVRVAFKDDEGQSCDLIVKVNKHLQSLNAPMI